MVERQWKIANPVSFLAHCPNVFNYGHQLEWMGTSFKCNDLSEMPGQMEYLTTVSHISKLDPTGIKEPDYLNITFPGFAGKEFAKAFTFAHVVIS